MTTKTNIVQKACEYALAAFASLLIVLVGGIVALMAFAVTYKVAPPPYSSIPYSIWGFFVIGAAVTVTIETWRRLVGLMKSIWRAAGF